MSRSNRFIAFAFVAVGVLVGQRAAVADDYLGAALAPQNAPGQSLKLLTATEAPPVVTDSPHGECCIGDGWIVEAEGVFLARISISLSELSR